MRATSKFILAAACAVTANTVLAENAFQAVKQAGVKWEAVRDRRP